MTASQRSASGAIPFWRRKLTYQGVLSALAAAAIVAVPVAADARITKVTIGSKESPTFGGYSWPGVGQYEKIVGIAYGELDPNDPHNAVITDIKLAPRNAAGRVEYSHDVLHREAHRPCEGQSQDGVRRGQPRGAHPERAQSQLRGQRSRPRSPTRRRCRRRSIPSRGYTHRGERMGLFRRHEHGQQQPVDPAADRQEPGRLVHHRTGVRVHRGQRRLGGSHVCRRHARQVAGEAHASRASRRRAADRARRPGGTTTRPARRSAWSAGTSSTTTSTSSATRRRIPASTASASPRCATSSPG